MFAQARKRVLPWADIVSPVYNISIATFLGTDLPTATAGVEQNSPMCTLEMQNEKSVNTTPDYSL